MNFTDIAWQHFTLGGGQKAVSIFYQWPSMRANHSSGFYNPVLNDFGAFFFLNYQCFINTVGIIFRIFVATTVECGMVSYL